MKNNTKILVSAMLLGLTMGVTGCENNGSDPSTSTSKPSTSVSQPSISTSNSSTIKKVFVDSVDQNTNLIKYLGTIESKNSKFMDKTHPYVVGDDNNFKFKPTVKFVDENDDFVEVEEVKFKIDLYVDGDTGYNLVPDYRSYADSLDNINCEINFNEHAIGKKFKISVVPEAVDPSQLKEFTKEFEVMVVDGFNIYNAKELAYFNKNREDSTYYKDTTGIDFTKEWEDFKTANNLNNTADKKAFIFHTDIAITDDDIPQGFFFKKGDNNFTDDIEGSLRDYANIYYRTFNSDSDSFTIYGNYFSLDASKISCIKQETESNGKPVATTNVISHTSLFRTEKSETATGKGSFVLNDLNLIGNSQRQNNIVLSGGLIFNKNDSMNATINNVVSNSWFISYFTQYNDSNYIVNKCYARDNFNSFFYNFGGNLTINDSDMEQSGGPVIIQDYISYENSYSRKQEQIGSIVINRSRLENWVSGSEGWFQLVPGVATQVTAVKDLNQILNFYKRTYLKTKDNVTFFNFICATKDSASLLGEAKGSVKIDDAAIFDFGASTPNSFGAFYNAVKSSGAPILQSSLTDGYGFVGYTDADNKTLGLLDGTNTMITNSNHPLLNGDYISLYRSGLMLTFGYYPVEQ